MDYNKSQANADKTPQEYRNGPIPNEYRSKTDVFWCLLMVIYMIGIVAVGVYAIKNGNPERIVQGYDPDHRACGIDHGVENFPFIYFATPEEKYLYRTVCVSSCPKSGDVLLQCAPNSVVTSCACNPCTTGGPVQVQGPIRVNPADEVLIYDTTPFGQRVCVPTNQKYEDQITPSMVVDRLQNMWNDVKTSKYILLGAVLFAFVVSLLFIYFVDKFAGCLVWSLIGAIIGMMLLFAYSAYAKYAQTLKIEQANKLNPGNQNSGSTAVQNANVSSEVYLVSSLVILAITFLIIVLVVCGRRTINLTIAILKAGSEFLEDNVTLIRVPIISFALFASFITGVLIVTLYEVPLKPNRYLYSCGEVSTKPHQLPFGALAMNQQQQYMGYYLLLGIVWYSAFLAGTVDFVTSGTVCNWYFKQGKSGHHMQGNVSSAINRYITFHSGSVALGSFLLTLVFGVRMVLQSLQRAHRSQGDEVTNFVLKCMICCVVCFEQCLQAINDCAYTQINMTGKSFCSAGAEGARLMTRNARKYVSVISLGELLIVLGKFSITFATAYLTYTLVTHVSAIHNNVVYPWAPVIVACIIGYTVSSMFMSLYGISITAILQVFCMDEEIESHFGKQEAALCPPALKDFLDANRE